MPPRLCRELPSYLLCPEKDERATTAVRIRVRMYMYSLQQVPRVIWRVAAHALSTLLRSSYGLYSCSCRRKRCMVSAYKNGICKRGWGNTFLFLFLTFFLFFCSLAEEARSCVDVHVHRVYIEDTYVRSISMYEVSVLLLLYYN